VLRLLEAERASADSRRGDNVLVRQPASSGFALAHSWNQPIVIPAELDAMLPVRLSLPNNVGQFVSQKAHALRTSPSREVLDDMDPRMLGMSSHIRAYGSPLTQCSLRVRVTSSGF